MPTCFVPGCRTGYGQSKGVHLFSPPSDKTEFQKWAQAIRRKDRELTRKCYICYCHFSEEMVIKVDTFKINGETVQLPRSKWKLKPGAVPHIFPNLPNYLSKSINLLDIPRIMNKETALEESKTTWSDTSTVIKEEFIPSGSEHTSSDVHIVIKEELIINEADGEQFIDEDVNGEESHYGKCSSGVKDSETDESQDLDLPQYKCNICSKDFYRLSDLSIHKLIHSGIKKYQCDMCNKVFTRTGNLLRHKLIHSRIKKYHCDVCNKVFTVESSLSIHKLIHSGIKKYQCDVCNKAFT